METRAREALVRADILTGIEKEQRSSALTKTFMKKKKKKEMKRLISYVGRISEKSAFSFLWLTSNGIARDLISIFCFLAKFTKIVFRVSIIIRMFRNI